MAAAGGKATFTDLEGGAGSFTVQYNPKEFKFDKSVSWGEHKDQGPETNGLEFTKLPPATLSMDLYFDTTNEGNGDVSKKVEGLLAFTNATVDVSSGEGETKKKRPPKISFTWGSFTMPEAVFESINTTYLMFSETGTPIRARVSVKLKEFNISEFSGSGGGEGIPGSMIQLVASSGGTASGIAQQHGVTTRQLLDANPSITNPMDVPAGLRLLIPFL